MLKYPEEYKIYIFITIPIIPLEWREGAAIDTDTSYQANYGLFINSSTDSFSKKYSRAIEKNPPNQILMGE